MYEITMPKLSDSMEEGKIIQWKVSEGQEVHEGDILAEIESDKAAMELECFHAGRVAKIVRGDGAEAPVGEVIAYIASPEEAKAAPPKPEGPKQPPPKVEEQKAEALPVRAEAEAPPPGRRLTVSPYARKLAEARGIDYTKLKGIGEGGRIMARDVEAAARTPRAEAEKPGAEEDLPPLELAPDEADVEEASFRLRTQARHVTAAKHLIPHFYVTAAVDVTRLLQRRAELKERTGATVTHLVMLACLKSVGRHPEVNRSYDRGHVITWKNVNLGLAVDTDQGLTVAVLAGAQKLSLREIVASATSLAEKARGGRLSPEERRHPTFTISNLGMFEVEEFAAILNPPSSVTLAVASALDAPVIRNGGIYIGKVMRLTVSCDHRIIDGVTASRFLKELKGLLENPDALLEGAIG